MLVVNGFLIFIQSRTAACRGVPLSAVSLLTPTDIT